MKTWNKVSRKIQGLPLALEYFLSGKCFPCRMSKNEIYSKVWDLAAAPDSLVFRPAGVKGRRGLLAPSACLCRVARGLSKVGLGWEGCGRMQTVLPVPCPCPAGGSISTDSPLDSHLHIGGHYGRGVWGNMYIGPRKGSFNSQLRRFGFYLVSKCKNDPIL